jgi:hypothetical protein
LNTIKLPDPDDVAKDIRRYMKLKKQADELEEKLTKSISLLIETCIIFMHLLMDRFGWLSQPCKMTDSSSALILSSLLYWNMINSDKQMLKKKQSRSSNHRTIVLTSKSENK